MPRRHLVLVLVVVVFWGANFVVIDLGLETFPPLLFAALRFLLVAFPAIFFVKRPPIPWRYVLGVGAFLSGGQFALLFTGMELGMPAGLASVVVQLQTVFTMGLAVAFLGERPSRRQVLGAGIALAGMGLIAAGRIGPGVPAGAFLLCVGAAASWGTGNVITRRARAPSALPLLVWSSLVAPLPLLGLSFALEGSHDIGRAFASLDFGAVFALAYVVGISTWFGYGVWTWMLGLHPASKVAPFTLLVPPVGIVTAWIARGEEPSAIELAGTAVALAGLALVSLAVRRPTRSARGRSAPAAGAPCAAPAAPAAPRR